MIPVLLLLAITPVSLTVDLSKSTTARLGPKVRELIEERLLEEGFSIEPVAKVKLRVEELHGTLRLAAEAGDHSESSELRPATSASAGRGHAPSSVWMRNGISSHAMWGLGVSKWRLGTTWR